MGVISEHRFWLDFIWEEKKKKGRERKGKEGKGR